MARTRPVAVIGAGITGLVAARSIASAGLDVIVLEASSRPGGKIRTARLEGITVEEGPDAFLPRDRRPLEICEEIGLGAELVHPSEFGAHVWTDGRLEPLPKDLVLGFPTSLASLRRGRIVGMMGVARAAFDLVRPGRLEGPDVSVDAYARRRLGGEVADKLVDPLLAGTRAGRPDTMSLAAAAPEVDRAARSSASIMRGLRDSAPGRGGPLFYAPRGGMTDLVDRLAGELAGAELKTGAPVARVSGGGSIVEIETASEIEVSAVVSTLPSFETAALIEGLDDEAAEAARAIPHSSGAVVNLVFAGAAVEPPPTGSGILVPSDEERVLSACTWSYRKWPHHMPDDGRRVIRCFVGRAGRHRALDQSDRALVEDALEDLSVLVPVRSDPVASAVARWERGLPAYEVGHLDRVAALEERCVSFGLFLAGASYRGSGIPDCIRQAERAAAGVVRFLRS